MQTVLLYAALGVVVSLLVVLQELRLAQLFNMLTKTQERLCEPPGRSLDALETP